MPGYQSPSEPPFPWRSDMLEGKVAIVTGGSAGIGAAITDCLVKAGAKVVVMARSKGKYDKLMAEKGWSEENVHFVPIDLNNADDIKKAASAANDWAGGCADILINNGESPGALFAKVCRNLQKDVSLESCMGCDRSPSFGFASSVADD